MDEEEYIKCALHLKECIGNLRNKFPNMEQIPEMEKSLAKVMVYVNSIEMRNMELDDYRSRWSEKEKKTLIKKLEEWMNQ